ncbi:hypothetical protein AB0H28_28650 [Micromonospora sp. NPDC050980]|uniref:hypothetical protein n=1 Tax=Micromonospora sp. NPDC050980 TaxID=3155161 RepID=UPI0033F76635
MRDQLVYGVGLERSYLGAERGDGLPDGEGQPEGRHDAYQGGAPVPQVSQDRYGCGGGEDVDQPPRRPFEDVVDGVAAAGQGVDDVEEVIVHGSPVGGSGPGRRLSSQGAAGRLRGA